MLNSSAISWYGKLPGAGDFLQRRFPDPLKRQWSQWFQVGLFHWQKDNAEHQTARQFNKAPVWNFVIPPMLESQHIQMGCLLPSHDSVGRQYPLCAMRIYSPSQWSSRQLSLAGPDYQQLGRILFNAVRYGYGLEPLEHALNELPPHPVSEDTGSDILEALGHDNASQNTLEWAQVAQCFDPQRQSSFWWTNRSDGHPLYTHVHSGNFTSQLFTLLFSPAGGARPGRHGLYPPMFE